LDGESRVDRLYHQVNVWSFVSKYVITALIPAAAFIAMQVSDIITIDPEQARVWDGFVRSNPSRVVHALSLGFHDRPNKWGDKLAVCHLEITFLCVVGD